MNHHHPLRDMHLLWVPEVVALAAITLAGVAGIIT